MRLMMFCNAFNLPIITFVDTRGFVVGQQWENQGILRHGAKLLYGYANANVVMGSKTSRSCRQLEVTLRNGGPWDQGDPTTHFSLLPTCIDHHRMAELQVSHTAPKARHIACPDR